MSNFSYLNEALPSLFQNALGAERHGKTDPRSSCMYARMTLESTIQWMYDYDTDLRRPYDNNLNALIREESFKQSCPPQVFQAIEIIRKSGNNAVHDSRPVAPQTSLFVVKSLHSVLYWFYRCYFDSMLQVSFNPAFIPDGTQSDTSKDKVAELEQKLQKQQEEVQAKEAKALDENEKLKAELEETKRLLADKKEEAKQTPDKHDYSEAETRTAYIDLLLREVGWEVPSANVIFEYPLDGIKRNKDRSGKGDADYVLFGDDGLPLAVIEAKRTSIDSEQGKYQAEDYADALEKKFNQRPIIFYTNGYKHFLWDDTLYPPREVSGFYKKEELQRLINRRQDRVSLTDAKVNEDIAGRSYQKMAIKSVCEKFERGTRKSLIVMATGTGKTRTTIALTELLQKNNWAKRVLFLCDRKSLRNQAKKAFLSNLPNSPAVILGSKEENEHARICTSTYQSMMNQIDKFKNGQRTYSAGHFDLIVLDEAHRSIYQKFSAIFKYFDSLLVGLTATPRSEVDKNTYDLFEEEDGVPSYAFELDEAVAKGFLVPYNTVKVATSFSRDGLTYSELSEDEKEEYEKHFSDEETGQLPEAVEGTALGKWLFNAPTVDAFLKNLMEMGIKVNDGDTLGKTIIFAKNKEHAEFIVKRFDANYPQYAGKFTVRIDYSLGDDAQTQIDKFSEKDSYPQIAVSVDMLDTGIDVPEVVNLVLAKPVYSKTKFWQMIGRGTRLCPNLFGLDHDKKDFLVFDYCGNFDYFEANTGGREGRAVESISTKIFNETLSLAHALSKSDEPEDKIIRTKSIDTLHNYVNLMNNDNFIVRPHLEYVERYKKRDEWNILTDTKVSDITTHISKLPSEKMDDDHDAKRWDLVMLQTQLALVNKNPQYKKLVTKVQNIAKNLEDLISIPDVKKHIALIESIADPVFWEGMNLTVLEEIREKLRELIKFIEPSKRPLVYSSFEDIVEDVSVGYGDLSGGNDLIQYRKKMEAKIRENENHITINKLKHNQPITQADLDELDRILFENEDDKHKFEDVFGSSIKDKVGDEEISLGVLIRSIVGLNQTEIEELFSEFIQKASLSSIQQKFVDQVIQFMVRNGIVPMSKLYEPPFSDIHEGGPDEVFGEAGTDELVGMIEEFNQCYLSA